MARNKLTDDVLRETVRLVEQHGGAKAAQLLGIGYYGVKDRLAKAKLRGIEKKKRVGRNKAEPSIKTPQPIVPKPVPVKSPLATERDTTSEEAKRRWWQTYVDGGRKDTALLHILLQKECTWLKQVADKRCRTINYRIPFEDLYQEGYIGLVGAAKSYDPGRGFKFQTYAQPRVFGAMQDLIRQNDPVTRNQRQRSSSRLIVAKELLHALGRQPTDDEICETMGLTYEEYVKSLPADTDSISRIVIDGDTQMKNVGDFLRAVCDGPDHQDRFERFCRRLFKGLSLDQQTMCWLYFVRGATMKNIGCAFDMSESRISQIFTHDIKEKLFRAIRRDDMLDELQELAG